MNLDRCSPPLPLVASLAIMLALAGCERPEVPLPQPAAAVAQKGAMAAAEPAQAAGLVPASVASDYAAWSTCNMEQVDGQPFSGKPLDVKAGNDFVVTGFVYIEQTSSVPADIKLRLLPVGNASAWEGDMKGRVDRPDIPQYFKLGQWAAGAGVEQLFSSVALSPGTYHLMFTFSDNGTKLACDNGREIRVLP